MKYENEWIHEKECWGKMQKNTYLFADFFPLCSSIIYRFWMSFSISKSGAYPSIKEKKGPHTPAKFQMKRNKWNWIGEIHFFLSRRRCFPWMRLSSILRVFYFVVVVVGARKSKRKLKLFRYLTPHLNGNKRWDERKKNSVEKTRTKAAARVVDSIKKVAFWFAFHHSSKCRFDEQLLNFCPEFKCMINDKRKTKKDEHRKTK